MQVHSWATKKFPKLVILGGGWKNHLTRIKFQGLGWICRVRKVRNSHFILIPKNVALGSLIKKGDCLQQFGATFNDKTILITVLNKEGLEEIKTAQVEKNTFMIQSIA